MKTSIVALATCALLAVPLTALAKKGGGSGGSHAVRGHITKKGSYVKPTRATNPDKTKTNNYSQKGNVNPANGKQGTKN